MNGVAAINLDKLRGYQMKKYLRIIIVVYLVILLLSALLLPDRVKEYELGYVDENYDEDVVYAPKDGVLRLRNTFTLDDSSLS